ncbi:MAG: hypothetical protein QF926_13025 [Alphaproteobacteria bacterium]|jgi:hypothetical protein|nr:hypothetical protein [Alphaproteobacteria bacterium]
MPIEIRHTIFSETEVVEALRLYQEQLGDPYPPGTLESFALDTDDDIEVVLDMVLDKLNRPFRAMYDQEELREAFIVYCLEHRIPMPATGASETVEIFDGKLALVISLTPKS